MPVHSVRSVDSPNIRNTYGPRVIARGSNGRIWSVFAQDSPRRIYALYTEDKWQSWSEQVIAEVEGFTQTDPAIAIDSNDTVHVVWSGRGYGENPQQRQILHRAYTSEEWGEVEVITDLAHGQYRPAIAIDSNDYVHVVWAGIGWGENTDRINIQYRRKTDSWGTVEQISDQIYDQDYPSISIDLNNTVHVVWQGLGYDAECPDTLVSIQYREKTASWEDIVVLTPFDEQLPDSPGYGHYFPSIAVDRKNTVYAAWAGVGYTLYSQPHLCLKIYKDGQWENTRTLSYGTAYYPQVGVDEDCTVYIAYTGTFEDKDGKVYSYCIATVKISPSGEVLYYEGAADPFPAYGWGNYNVNPGILCALHPRFNGISPNIPTNGFVHTFVGAPSDEIRTLAFYDSSDLLFDAYYGFQYIQSGIKTSAWVSRMLSLFVDADYAHGTQITLVDVRAAFGRFYYLLTQIAADPVTDFATLLAYIGTVKWAEVEETPPIVWPESYPVNGMGGIGQQGPIYIRVHDAESGIDLNSLQLTVNDVLYEYGDSEVLIISINPPYTYVIKFVPSTPWQVGSTVDISLTAQDRAGNVGLAGLQV